VPVGRDWVGEQIDRIAHRADLPDDHGQQLNRYLATVGYPGPEVVRTARDILTWARSWKPDVIVRENAEFGGYLAAEVLGLPHETSSVVAVGPHTELFGPAPPSVRLVDRIAQPLMVECSAVFIHHGGFNSVREGLRLGVPMVVLPWITDSVQNARRCAEAGLARVLHRDEVTPEAVRQVCAEVLAEPAYRDRAEAMRRRILTLPSMDDLVVDIETLVTG
jgi:UDP:flavonoid glycosyltransferase YjiC (YdhE family)